MVENRIVAGLIAESRFDYEAKEKTLHSRSRVELFY